MSRFVADSRRFKKAEGQPRQNASKDRLNLPGFPTDKD